MRKLRDVLDEFFERLAPPPPAPDDALAAIADQRYHRFLTEARAQVDAENQAMLAVHPDLAIADAPAPTTGIIPDDEIGAYLDDHGDDGDRDYYRGQPRFFEEA